MGGATSSSLVVADAVGGGCVGSMKPDDVSQSRNLVQMMMLLPQSPMLPQSLSCPRFMVVCKMGGCCVVVVRSSFMLVLQMASRFFPKS